MNKNRDHVIQSLYVSFNLFKVEVNFMYKVPFETKPWCGEFPYSINNPDAIKQPVTRSFEILQAIKSDIDNPDGVWFFVDGVSSNLG